VKKVLETNSDLVMLSVGYYVKYVMPVAAATEIMKLMVQTGAAKVEADERVYYSIPLDLKLEALDYPFMGDVPVNPDKRQKYIGWLKTKRSIVGDDYEPEPYSVYLASKENES